MDYLKLYVSFRDDPKIVGLSDRAFRAHVVTLCWVAQHETDGRIALEPSSDVVDELLKVGLWDRLDDGGIVVHNWSKFQRTHAELHAKRIAARKAARTRWSNAERNAERELRFHAEVEVEVEEEVEEERTSSRTTTSAQKRARDPIWDALVDLYGEPTASARGAWNAAAKALRDYGTQPNELQTFVDELRGSDRDWAVVTPMAAAKYYGQREALLDQAGSSRSRSMAAEARRRET